VEQTPLELVEAADVVDVRVRDHADDLSRALRGREACEVAAQRAHPVAGVDEEVAVSPAEVPQACSEQLVHVRLGERRGPPGHPGEAEPVGGDRELGRAVHAVILPAGGEPAPPIGAPGVRSTGAAQAMVLLAARQMDSVRLAACSPS
jgi:hypothetical protein